MADIVVINPRFEQSFWGLEMAMPLFGKRANVPVAALPLLAALTPAGHTVTLIDENVEDLDYDRVARADLVAVTGMSVQRHRMKEVLAELKRRGAFTVVGGAWVTVEEDYFGDLADVIFVGEAEETWPQFLAEWQQGRHQRRYEQAEKSDMSKVPTPRFDLLRMDRYMFGSLQFSRGCPFQCEFCDIIVTFGRRPRLKTTPQVLAELEALVAQGMRFVMIVDDNLIGNKKAVKVLLRDLIAWQERNGYPLVFFTEASLDLAEDAEMMELMADANIQCVFIGIESPNEASLRETKKFQNVRPVGTILERVRRVQDAGMEVWCGMIVGFDHDDPTIFAAQCEFLKESRIVMAMVGMLHAIPKTPLHARLAAEGRLDPDDVPEFGTNVIPLHLGREALRDGYLKVNQTIYEPRAYFKRVEEMLLHPRLRLGRGQERYWRRHPWAGLKARARYLAEAAGLFARLMTRVPDARLRREYRKRIEGFLDKCWDPVLIHLFVVKCVVHYHHFSMVRGMTTGASRVVGTF